MAKALAQGKTWRMTDNKRARYIAMYVIRKKAEIVAQLPGVVAMKSRQRRTAIDKQARKVWNDEPALVQEEFLKLVEESCVLQKLK